MVQTFKLESEFDLKKKLLEKLGQVEMETSNYQKNWDC